MKYTTYNPSTGEILHTYTVSDDSEVVAPSIIGEYDAQTYYVDQGTAIAKPDRPNGEYYFDYGSKTWQLDAVAQSTLMRFKRNQLLTAVDRVNPVWYNTLTDQQRGELAAYRQALLDVPQQSGFPESVVWPTQPTWF